MLRFFRHPWGWTTVAPLACAVHCLLTPVLVVAAPSLAPGPRLEWALLAVTLLVAGLSLGGGLRTHGDLRPAVPITAGLSLWVASLLLLFHPVPEELTTIAAALIVAGGLMWNSRLHCARRAECAACAEAEAPAPVPLPVAEVPRGSAPQTG